MWSRFWYVAPFKALVRKPEPHQHQQELYYTSRAQVRKRDVDVGVMVAPSRPVSLPIYLYLTRLAFWPNSPEGKARNGRALSETLRGSPRRAAQPCP